MCYRGYKHSEETKKKISNSELGEKNPFYGKHHTKETKDKIRLANLGKNIQKKQKRK